jgi:LPS-assembly lipoprotein
MMGLWARVVLMCAAAATTAGCFQPLYTEQPLTGGPGVSAALNAVDVLQIDAPTGTEDARIAVELRNDLLFGLQGGSGGGSPTHSLKIRLTPSRYPVIVDLQTARASSEIYGLTATYSLTDLRTGRVVLNEQTFSRVSYDIPGEQQRFARARALRDAENRAAQVIADNIRARLASYFVAGS